MGVVGVSLSRRRARTGRTALLGTRVLLAGVLVAALLAPASTGTGQVPDAEPARVVRKPNIVLFLVDDMAAKQLQHLPHTRRLVFTRGARFSNYLTSISLCCPARASLLTGKYAHNTGIIGNEYPDGFHGFHVGDERHRTFAVALRRRAGYRTSLLGKYLNEYPFVESRPRHAVRATFVPRGWSDWAVPIRGQYAGVDYDLNVDGRIRHHDGPRDYLGDLLTRRAVRQIRANRDDRDLAMVLSFYGPHEPAPASPVERRNEALKRRIAAIDYPRTPDFNERNVRDKPRFIRTRHRLGPRVRRAIDRTYRRQLLSLASIDRHVRTVVRALRRTGQLDDTYLVFTSDHGYHLGTHRLREGKNTAYRDDVNVPFAVRGPGIEPGSVVREVVGPMDVAPTFADMAGTTLPWRHDGESLLPLARGRTPQTWRDWLLLRHGLPFGGTFRSSDEPASRAERRAAVSQPGYQGVAGRRWQYVRYGTGEQELYDGASDPFQLHNLMAREDRTEEQQQALADARRALRRLRDCRGVVDCRR